MLVAIHPGEILLEDFMKPLELSVEQLAYEAGISATLVEEIISARRPVTADLADLLGRRFGISSETWLMLQRDYDRRRGVKP